MYFCICIGLRLNKILLTLNYFIKSLIDICAIQSTCFNLFNLIYLCIFDDVPLINLSLIVRQITLVTNNEYDHSRWTLCLQFLHPIINIDKTFLIRYIIHDQCSDSTSIVAGGNCSISFLSSCIPNLCFDNLIVFSCNVFCCKFYADCGLAF